ncbi:acyl-CoA dehydrogenase [Marihabitans asiaticum]|uniref:acyl-CoA oxidase n=1 Tax=Marihabitans asiaticum TaxID=415218 RepID=A0A560W6R1_9MICO|nr:acyl-CoA dehydrogenase [Marihabitans asiaticum]TWD13311.1 acyl-coenzyme A oxidase [Marihabitans asiaticum]
MGIAEQIQTTLDGRWGEVRQQLRAQLDPDTFGPPAGLIPLDEHRQRTLDAVLQMTKTDAPRDGLTIEQGGTNEHGASVTAFEMLGHADLSVYVKAGVQFGLFGGAVANLGTQRHWDEYLPGMLDGTLLGCFAMTETGHGSDVQSLLTTATYLPDSDEIEINTPSLPARKDYIGNAARDGHIAAVFAQLVVDGENHGVHCVLVPIRDDSGEPRDGVTIGDCGAKMGLRGVDNGRLTFDHVRVPRLNLLNRYGTIDDDGRYHSPIENPSRRFFTMLGTLVRGRISVAGGAGAATRTALTLAITYGLHRKQFTAPDSEREVTILDYRGHQRKLFPRLARSYALMLAQNALVEQMHRIAAGEETSEEAQRELEARAAGIKALTTEHATDTIQVCREACGGAGYLSVNRFADLKADTDVFTTFEGDNTVLLQLVAKGMLTGYKEAFHELDTRGAFFFGARQVTEAVIERTIGGSLIQRLISGSPGRDADNALSDRGGHLDLFEDREKHLLETLAMRLRRAGDDDADGFTVFNDAQPHLLLTARAHIERVILEAFVSAIDATPEGEARDLLDRVCDLYVMSTIEENRAWFLEHGRLSASQAKGVTASVDELCDALRPHAQTLIDAFAIPMAWRETELLEFLGETSEDDGQGVARRSATQDEAVSAER